jgi:hypothetical protein
MKYFTIVGLLLVATGCSASWSLGKEPVVCFGQRVVVVNGLANEVDISYRGGLWNDDPSVETLAPGQEGIVSGLRDGAYLVAQIKSEKGDVIGTTDFRVRRQRRGNPQIWRIRYYSRLR